MKKIVIKIDKKSANIISEAFGYNGVECHFDLDAINKILSANTIYSENKDDNEYVLNIKEVKSGNSNR